MPDDSEFLTWLLDQTGSRATVGHLARQAKADNVTPGTLAAWLESAPRMWVEVATLAHKVEGKRKRKRGHN